VPERMCDFCDDEPVDGRFREVNGIEEKRRQGGANKIIARRETGRLACWTCARKMSAGTSLDQLELSL
jgi:hypothetical protein